jgi:hypothetical protein
MKVILLFYGLLTVFMIPQTLAQDIEEEEKPGIQFGIQGGLSLQKFAGTDYWGDKLSDRSAPGIHGGGNMILPVFHNFYIQPGLLYSVKGSKQDIITENITKTVFLSYIELPLNILFRPETGRGHLLIGAGAYIGYGISGRERTKTGTYTIEVPVKFIADASGEPTSYAYYRPFDAGVNFYIGYELYGGIVFQLEAQMGFLEINSDYGQTNDQTVKKNRGFGFSVGYRFK